MGNEIWAPIPGYNGKYEASTLGCVRSMSYRNKKEVHTLKEADYKGYLKVRISMNGSAKSMLVHQLVARTFIENPDNKPEIDHIDGDPKNNRVENLRWCTKKENMNNPISIERHSRAAKISVPKAWKSGFYKIMPRRVAQLSKEGEIICVWESVSMAARELGLSLGNLFACIWGQRKTCGGYKWEYIEPGKRKNANNRRMEELRAKLVSHD